MVAEEVLAVAVLARQTTGRSKSTVVVPPPPPPSSRPAHSDTVNRNCSICLTRERFRVDRSSSWLWVVVVQLPSTTSRTSSSSSTVPAMSKTLPVLPLLEGLRRHSSSSPTTHASLEESPR